MGLADMATMRDALKKESLEVEAKLAYVPVDGFVTQEDLVTATLPCLRHCMPDLT